MMKVTYPEIHLPQWQGRRLRGFFASDQEDEDLLHNHDKTGGSMYRYPLVQYKVIREVPTVVAIEDGIRAVYPLVMERQTLQIGDQTYPAGHMDIELSSAAVGETGKMRRYRFCAPWFGLNQKNYRQYVASGSGEREALLQRILIGNLLSLSKGLGITVEHELRVTTRLEERRVTFKSEPIVGFVGEFSANYVIPPLLGLGKSVSRGFGAVLPVPGNSGRQAALS